MPQHASLDLEDFGQLCYLLPVGWWKLFLPFLNLLWSHWLKSSYEEPMPMLSLWFWKSPNTWISHFLPPPRNTTLMLATDMKHVPGATKPLTPIVRWKWHPSRSQILGSYMFCPWDLSISPDRVGSEMKIYSVIISYISFKQWEHGTVQTSVIYIKWISKFLTQLTCHASKVQVPCNSSSLGQSPDTGYDPKPLSTEVFVTKRQHWRIALGSQGRNWLLQFST